jgi:hypothetical protein
MLMNNIGRILLALVAAVIVISPLAAEERGQQRYIVILKNGLVLRRTLPASAGRSSRGRTIKSSSPFLQEHSLR